MRETIFSWDHGFPLEEYGDDCETPIRDVLDPALRERLEAWSDRFTRAWDWESGEFESAESRAELDREYRVLADDLRSAGIVFEERPWWRTETA